MNIYSIEKYDESELKANINNLEQELKKKKEELFLNRLMKMFDSSILNASTDSRVNNLHIQADLDSKTWSVSYTHKTTKYSKLDYLYEDGDTEESNSDTNVDSDVDHDVDRVDDGAIADSNTGIVDHDVNNHSLGKVDHKLIKTTEISFGKNKNYFIKGGIKFNVYRNSAKDLRIINSYYDVDLDMDEQFSLISKYSQNPNIAEWIAVAVFLYIAEHKWDDIAIIKHFSIV